jgi:hypothetical protein
MIDPCAPQDESVAVAADLTPEEVAAMQQYEAIALPAAAEAETEEAYAPGCLPIPFAKRWVSGRYRGGVDGYQMELRVDVDGTHPMLRLSGDCFQPSDGTLAYLGSWVVDSVDLNVADSVVTITGEARTTWSTSFNKIKVTIPHRIILVPPAAATIEWFDSAGERGNAYLCKYESAYLRSIDFEQDREQSVKPFVSYNTGSLPSGGPARKLTIAEAYAEAGIEMRTASVCSVVPTAPGSSWSDAELHNAMVAHFSLWANAPQWKVWMLHAYEYESPGVLGIMFDQLDQQRQGAAVFYKSMIDPTPENQRAQLFALVHELGHSFNLFHSFQKQYTTPSSSYRPSALSYMNYPHLFPAGQAAFWNAFPFTFDDQELVHLRHAYRNNIIMGGDLFGVGAALTEPAAFADPIENGSGLRFELESAPSFAYGEPVVVEAKLYLTDRRGKQIHTKLHPKTGFVQIGVQKPSGEVVVYKPLMEQCVAIGRDMLDQAKPSVYESAYIGYDQEKGHIFDRPGMYKLRGVYYALDGSRVLSPVISLRVRYPLTAADEEVAELFLGDEQGALLFLLGSDSESLKRGNEAFDLVLDKHPNHELAVYACLVKGFSAAREFKTITPDLGVEVRKPQPEAAVALLSSVVEASKVQQGVDNITLNMTMQRMALTQIEAGDRKGAWATICEMGAIFSAKKLKPHVEELIKSQLEVLRTKLERSTGRRWGRNGHRKRGM